MNARTCRTRVAHGLLIGLIAAGACFGVAAQPAFSGEGQPAPSGETLTGPGTSNTPQPAGKPGAVPAGAPMVIYVDPQTGALLKEPAPGSVPLQLTPQLRNAFSTSHQGLVETPISTPGGGVKVDLQGRFRSPLIATTDASGKVRIQHLDEMPGTDGKK